MLKNKESEKSNNRKIVVREHKRELKEKRWREENKESERKGE